MSKTIIVSNRLPVRVVEQEDGYGLIPSEGGLATGIRSVHAQSENLWIGWPGVCISGQNDQKSVTALLGEQRLVPLFLDDDEIKGFYEGFSNEVLWPIFHYTPSYANYDRTNWETYVRVNEKFRDLVLQYAEPEDTIWVHDYQLLLLPGMIREALPDAAIGFFLHIPFPSQELFRLIPWRKELLYGMLGADLLGFHTFDDVRHFVSSATRLTATNNNSNRLEVDGRTIFAEPFPMGIDARRFAELSGEAEVRQRVEELKHSFGGRRIILSIDRLDYSKGILQRLEAFELFLRETPGFHRQVTLYMVVVPSRDKVPQYRELKDQIDRLVGHINAQYGTYDWQPVAYFYHGYPMTEITALYHAADICLVTPMRDGMNLVSKEYVACRSDETGVLILSEMAGAARELIDALVVNPNDIHDICRALVTALTMSADEMCRRMKAMREIVFKFNIQHWTKLFMDRLREIKHVQSKNKARLVGPTIEQHLIDAYATSSNRLLLLDYDGTLVGFEDNIDKASPDDDLYQLLDTLDEDIHNRLVIISGRKHSTLGKWFSDKPYTLIAEHGVWIREPNSEWQLRAGLNNSWKEEVGALMESYADRTPGAFVEEKSYSLAWHYRKVQRDLGPLRAHELIDSLRDFSAAYGLQLLDGDKVVEIRSAEINKGRAALEVLHKNHYDFMLAIGDDRTDEDTFQALPPEAFTIKVGTEVSAARFYLKRQHAVRPLLRQLANASTDSVRP